MALATGVGMVRTSGDVMMDLLHDAQAKTSLRPLKKGWCRTDRTFSPLAVWPSAL